MKSNSVALSVLGAVLALAPLVAGAVVIDSTTPTWSGGNGGTMVYNAVNGSFTDVRWGTSVGSGQSGLGFDPFNPPSLDYAVDAIFQLGSLRHYNNPIAGGTAASQVDLGLLTAIAGATPATQTFGFRFFIDETPNVTPCAYPSTTPCADRITFSNLSLTSSFAIGGTNYTIELLGFGGDAGSLLSYFDSQEAATNTTGLWARITEARSVPEPGTLALLGLGLVGLGFARRRKLS